MCVGVCGVQLRGGVMGFRILERRSKGEKGFSIEMHLHVRDLVI